MSEITVHYSYDYLSARSPRGLRVAMFKNDIRRKTKHKYVGIQFVNGKWYCWFQSRMDDNDSLIQELKGIESVKD
jgi:hypothetical protein